MRISSIYNCVSLISPYIEVMLRMLYWHNVKRFGKYNPHKTPHYSKDSCPGKSDFGKVLDWLKEKGVGGGDLLIVHSSYGELERTGLSPEEIVDKLLDLIGPSGTLAMPVIRRYKDMEKAKAEGKDLSSLTFKYNVKKTLVLSGFLPYTLMQRKDAVISHHPLNPLCAVGPLAEAMMEHNLDGENPSPHGPNSSWKFCYDHGAKGCSIGTDIEHHNTIGHIGEEAFGNWNWSDDEWYDHLNFEIIDEEKNVREITVRNRKEDWGKLYGAEIKVNHDAKKAGAMFSDCIDGITVGYVDPHRYFDLRKNKKQGYPYYVPFFVNVRNIK